MILLVKNRNGEIWVYPATKDKIPMEVIESVEFLKGRIYNPPKNADYLIIDFWNRLYWGFKDSNINSIIREFYAALYNIGQDVSKKELKKIIGGDL